MDFISQLPETILHNILNRLSPKEAARTCILSKEWNLIESRTPFMYFHESHFRSPENMLTFAEKRVEHFSENNLSTALFSFRFSLDSNYDHRLASLLKRAIYNAGTQLLGLNIKYYSLPHFVLQSHTLIALRLCGCKCKAHAEIHLPKLQELYLIDAVVDNHFVQQLIRGCPSLLRLKISNCSKLTNLVVTCLERIQMVHVMDCYILSNVEIVSPNLHSVKYVGFLRSLCHFTLARLKKLTLKSVTVKSSWPRHVASTCEKLTLNNVDCVKDIINILSENLIQLSIYNCNSMKNMVHIDCPNLQSLVYVNNRLPFRSLCEFTLLRDVRIECFIDVHLHSVWYNQLKDLFEKFSSIKQLIKQVVHHKRCEDLIILEGFKEFVIPELVDIEDLKWKEKVIVSTILNSRQLNKLMDHICNSLKCLKRSVYIASTHCSNNNFSHVLFDKLSKIGAEANCCQNATVKCWRHCLCNVHTDSTTNIIPAALRSQQFDRCQITTIILEFASEEISLE